MLAGHHLNTRRHRFLYPVLYLLISGRQLLGGAKEDDLDFFHQSLGGRVEGVEKTRLEYDPSILACYDHEHLVRHGLLLLSMMINCRNGSAECPGVVSTWDR